MTSDHLGWRRRAERFEGFNGVLWVSRCPERGRFGVQCGDEERAYPPPPVPAVPPSQTNDCKGFLRFKPSQRRPKSASSRPKGCGGVLLRVLSVRSAVEGGQFVRTVAAVRREALER